MAEFLKILSGGREFYINRILWAAYRKRFIILTRPQWPYKLYIEYNEPHVATSFNPVLMNEQIGISFNQYTEQTRMYIQLCSKEYAEEFMSQYREYKRIIEQEQKRMTDQLLEKYRDVSYPKE